MTHRILIDYNRRGWAEEMDTKIRSDYQEILKVGVEPNPPPDSLDEVIGSIKIVMQLFGGRIDNQPAS